jgi:membrane associated rhomboid family serine protease
MILPIHTTVRPRRTPYANYFLIAINVLVFFASYQPQNIPMRMAGPLKPWAEQFMLTPAQPQLWQFISYAFLHGGAMHIIGNMYFLYLFGNSVCDRLGPFAYVCFYLAGAVYSGIGHALLSSNPVLGASGAVAAVTGAYLVLFPRSLVTVIYWFIFIGSLDVSALYFIALKLIFIDNIIARYTPNVAYDAHLAGYAAGIASMLIVLASGMVPATGVDLWSMIRQWNRRRRYQNIIAKGYDPFESNPRRRVSATDVTKIQKPQTSEKIAKLRDFINLRTAERNLPAAAKAYIELMELDSGQIIGHQQLLDIANQLASENRNVEAAGAYEQFLASYGGYKHTEQVELMLGILYSRYLDRPSAAIKHLKTASAKLTDPGQIRMCEEELAKLEG